MYKLNEIIPTIKNDFTWKTPTFPRVVGFYDYFFCFIKCYNVIIKIIKYDFFMLSEKFIGKLH